MNIPMIDMPVHEARAAMVQYRNAVRERHSAEDAAILKGYREIVRGHKIINIVEAIRAGGRKDDRTHMPNLAVCRADLKWCFGDTNRDGSVTFSGSEGHLWRSGINWVDTVKLPPDTLDRRDVSTSYYRAMVPLIPPQFRPASALSNYHILWEAEWSRVAPRDPALLKHLGGYLYAVLAVWDLTEIERAVMGLRQG